MTKQCKDCGLVKHHLLKDKHTSSNYYVNENGSRWRGLRCPDCLKSDHKNPAAWGAKRVRSCRKCSRALPISRYFNCLICHNDRVENIYNLEGDYVY